MPLTKSIQKLKKYYARLEAGKAKKIKPAHVEKVMLKLQSKESSLLEEIDSTKKASKKKRLEQKLATTRDQLERAKWLRNNIN